VKIIHIIPHLGNGGAERLVVDLCNELSLSDEVTIVTFRDSNSSMFYLQDLHENVKLISFGKGKGLTLSLPFKIFRFFKKEKPLIVNSHLPATLPYLLLSVLLLRRITFFHTIHNTPREEEPRLFFRKLREGLHFLNRIHFIAISDNIAILFRQLYHFDAIGVAYNGRSKIEKTSLCTEVVQEINTLKINTVTKVFLSIGRLTEQKNYGLLLTVFNKLYKQKENVILIIIGDDYGTGMKTKYEKDKSPNTFFIGPKKNISDYLFNCDAFCLSSKFEGLPITILEAMSIGLPVISTAVGGIPDIIKNDENGFLSLSVNEDDFLCAIQIFLSCSDSKLEEIRNRNVVDFNLHYAISNTATQYLHLYKMPKIR
jgi:glycosyltransferase involved in cell wall biosynthesis